MSILFALLGAFSQALTSVLQRLANIAGADEKRSIWQTTLFLIRQPMWLLGMVCMGGTFVFTALALYFGRAGHRAADPGHRAHLHPGPAGPVAPRPHRHPDLGCRRASCVPASSGSWWRPIPAKGTDTPRPTGWIVALGQPRPDHRGPHDPQPLGIAGPPGRPARCRRRPGVGHRRRLRQGRHRGAGPRRLGRSVPPLAGVRGGGERRDSGPSCSSRRSPSARWPPPSRPCSSSTHWPVSPSVSSSSVSSSTARRSPSSLQVAFLAAMFVGVVLLVEVGASRNGGTHQAIAADRGDRRCRTRAVLTISAATRRVVPGPEFGGGTSLDGPGDRGQYRANLRFR